MTRDSTRRRFLATVGATGAASVAGCTDRLPWGNDNSGTPTDTRSNSTNGTTTPSGTSGPGEQLEDFENMADSNWGTVGQGKWTADSNQAFQGSQSVRLEAKQGQAAGLFKSFPDGLDLSSHDLSLAVKLASPAAGNVSAEVYAPGRSDSLASNRYLVKQYDQWLRIDLGYTGKNGNPQLGSVQELRFYVRGDNGPVKAWVDDLRKIPKPNKGKVMFHFDGALQSQYDIAFQRFKELGWPAGVSVNPGAVGTQGNLDTGQMREMQSAGWDMMSFPLDGTPLTAYSREKQRRKIKQAKRYLEIKGFEEGARHFVAPYNAVNETTVSVLKEVGHEAGYTFGACPNNASQPSGEYTISRINGRSPQGTRRLINLAAQYNQMVVVKFSSIGPGKNVPKADFENVVNHTKQSNVDIVAPSALLDG